MQPVQTLRTLRYVYPGRTVDSCRESISYTCNKIKLVFTLFNEVHETLKNTIQLQNFQQSVHVRALGVASWGIHDDNLLIAGLVENLPGLCQTIRQH